MAREPRWKRRYLAKSLLEILNTTPADKRRLRVVPPVDKGHPHYLFLLVPVLPGKTDAKYRVVRRTFLEYCCIVARLEYPDAEDVVGIATEPGINRVGRSEDAIYFDARGWSAEQARFAKELQEKLGILTKQRRIEENVQEYPDVQSGSVRLKNPRNKPCPCGSGKKHKHCCLSKHR